MTVFSIGPLLVGLLMAVEANPRSTYFSAVGIEESSGGGEAFSYVECIVGYSRNFSIMNCYTMIKQASQSLLKSTSSFEENYG